MNVRHSVLLSLFERYAGFAIQFAANIVIARLLTPGEIGVYSVCVALMGFIYVLREFGIANYLIQERDLNDEKVRTAFGLMILLSWPMAIVAWLSRDLIGQIYGNAEIGVIIGVVAINFIILPLGQPARALLAREMRFKSIVVIDVTSAAVHATIAVSFSALGHGPMSLAYASVAGTAATIVLTLFYEPRHIRLMPSLTHWRTMIRFGSYSTAAAFVSTAGTNAAEVVIGKALDLASVGLYSRAAGLVSLLQSQLPAGLARVALPGFSQMLRAGKKLEPSYLTALTHLTGFLWPAYVFVALAAEPIIGVLFGDQWLDATPIAQILCAAGALNAVIFLIHSVYGAHGAVKRRLAAESVIQSIRVVIILAAATFGLKAIAGAQVVTAAISGLVYHWAIHKHLRIDLTHILRAVWRSAIVAAITGISTVGGWIVFDVAHDAHALHLGLALLTGGLGWCTGLFVTRHVLGQEIQKLMGPPLRRILVWNR